MAEIDGRPADAAELQALALVNYGHFTTLRVDHGRVRGLGRHLQRLVRDCRAVFGAELDPLRVRRLVAQAVHGSRESSLVARVTVFDPSAGLADLAAEARPRILVTTRSVPAAAAQTPLRLGLRSFRRELPAVKHTGLFAALHHRRAAQREGWDDALFRSPTGHLTEGPTWNIGFLDGGRVVWPEADVLPGVTMGLLKDAGPACVTLPLMPEDLPGLQGAFTTNATGGIRPVRAVGGTVWDPGHRLIAELRRSYAAVPAEPLE